MSKQKTIIIGAGPAGLTAAYEFCKKTDIQPIILEKSGYLGGIAKTVNYKGNRIDIGGHRFFSKSEQVMNWWNSFFPIQKESSFESGNEQKDNVFLVRNRKSRIYYSKKFFDYPVTLSKETLQKLGLVLVFKIGFSYLKIKIFPIKPEKTLEDFFINRFGKKLYETFFRSYSEKVWGVPCTEISAEWGAQRIKGLSVTEVIKDYIRKKVFKNTSLEQKQTETSLIERFVYPKYGPGQFWEAVGKEVENKNGLIINQHEVNEIILENNKITKVGALDNSTGQVVYFEGDYFFSTMPIKDLFQSLKTGGTQIPDDIWQISQGLEYRNFITVGLLLNKLRVFEKGRTIQDNWLYIHEPEVQVARIQIFNNWSPYLVKDSKTAWVGLEYMCDDKDEIWNYTEKQMKIMAIQEMSRLGLVDEADVLDFTVIKEEKAYPGYFGTYKDFEKIKNYLKDIKNLYLIGRNGMHRYNNQDHSMLTAMLAVENIINKVKTNDNIWEVNTEHEYHEQKNS